MRDTRGKGDTKGGKEREHMYAHVSICSHSRVMASLMPSVNHF